MNRMFAVSAKCPKCGLTPSFGPIQANQPRGDQPWIMRFIATDEIASFSKDHEAHTPEFALVFGFGFKGRWKVTRGQSLRCNAGEQVNLELTPY